MFIVLFLHCLWGLGTTEPFFQIIALVYSLLGQTEGKRVFLEGVGKNGARSDYPK